MSSATSGKQSTAKTSALTAGQALEILQDVLLKYQKLGGKVTIIPEFWFDGKRKLAIVLDDVAENNGTLQVYAGGKAE